MMLRWSVLAVVAAALLVLTGAAGQVLASDTQVEPYISVGFGSHDFDWTIAPTSRVPSVLSELAWTDLETVELAIGATAIVDQRGYLRGYLASGSIRSGECRDSDYLGSSKTLEFSRSLTDVDGDLSAFSLGAGYLIQRDPSKPRLAALLGYSRSSLDLENSDLVQVVSQYGLAPPVGTRVAGPVATYEAEFAGPWLGFDYLLEQSAKTSYAATFEYHWGSYEGTGDWLKRADLAHPSIQHDADASGTIISVGARRKLNEHATAGLKLAFQNWSVEEGTDLRFFANGTRYNGIFNGASWDSFTFAVDGTYSW